MPSCRFTQGFYCFTVGPIMITVIVMEFMSTNPLIHNKQCMIPQIIIVFPLPLPGAAIKILGILISISK